MTTVFDTDNNTNLLNLTANITSAYVKNNTITSDLLTTLITDIHKTLVSISNDKSTENKNLVPAVPIDESITDDYIICLEDGKRLKMLKRYLHAQYNMTPTDYRNKWGLPVDYPLVAPSYAAKRSDYAKQFGLGKKAK